MYPVARKGVDRRLLDYYTTNMETRIVAIRKSGGQVSVTIPKKLAEKGGFNKVKYAKISQLKNGNLRIGRVELEEDREV